MGAAAKGTRHWRRLAMMWVAVVTTLSLGCGESATAPRQPGTITVAVTTTGGDLDSDGYQVVLGSERSLVGPSAVVILHDVKAGPYELTLEGVAANCSVVSPQPLSVVVFEGATTEASFLVNCEATGVLIRAHTTGSDQPLSFGVMVSTWPASVAANGTVVVSRIPPGVHNVTLTLPGNCRVAGDNPVAVDVSNRQLSFQAFEIDCARVETHIAFTIDSISGNVTRTWIAVADSTGAGVRALAAGTDPAWSPGGKSLVFSDYECGYVNFYDWECHGGLVVMDPATRSAITPANDTLGFAPSWSPDGNYIAFLRSADYSKLFVAPVDGSPAVRIDPPGVTEVRNPSWSPDSKTIVFQCKVQFGDLEICIVNRDGTGFKRLTTNRFYDDSPAWSPDGSRIAFTTIRPEVWDFGQPAIVLMTPSGTEDPFLTLGFDPAWSPDGSKLVFARSDGLFTIGADGSNVKRITTGLHRAPVWRP